MCSSDLCERHGLLWHEADCCTGNHQAGKGMPAVKVKSVAVLPGVAPVAPIPAVPGHWETDYEQVAVSGGSVSSSAGVVPLPVGISNNTEVVIWFARYLGLSVVVPSGSSQSEWMAAYNAAISARVGIFVVSLGPQYEYRPVSRWNLGKQQEYRERVAYGKIGRAHV